MIITMELKKITNDHYIIVDDSEIKEGDYIINIQRMHIYPTPVCADDVEYRNRRNDVFKKITHSTRPLEWFGGEIIFLSEVKELIGEVDVIKRKDEYLKKVKEEVKDYEQHDRIYILGTSDLAFTEGYNQALKDNKEKKWTDEDVIRIVEKSRETGLTAEYLMMTFQPKTEWEVEFVDGKMKLKK